MNSNPLMNSVLTILPLYFFYFHVVAPDRCLQPATAACWVCRKTVGSLICRNRKSERGWERLSATLSLFFFASHEKREGERKETTSLSASRPAGFHRNEGDCSLLACNEPIPVVRGMLSILPTSTSNYLKEGECTMLSWDCVVFWILVHVNELGKCLLGSSYHERYEKLVVWGY